MFKKKISNNYMVNYKYAQINNHKDLIKDIRSLERKRSKIKQKLCKIKHTSNIHLIHGLNKEYLDTIRDIYTMTKMIEYYN